MGRLTLAVLTMDYSWDSSKRLCEFYFFNQRIPCQDMGTVMQHTWSPVLGAHLNQQDLEAGLTSESSEQFVSAISLKYLKRKEN